MLRNLYARTLALAASPRAPWWLAVVAFAEASCFPIPPGCAVDSDGARTTARGLALCRDLHVASVIGGALGYFIGYAVFDQLAQPLIRFYGYSDRFAAFQALYAQYGLWVILIKGLTPIPYKIVTIASGAAHFDFWLFMAASLATRGMRFFLVAALLRLFGTPVRDFIERRLALVTGALAAGVVGGFVLLRLM